MPSNSLLFKPSVKQPISQTPFDLNTKFLFHYSGHGLNNKPFDDKQTVLDCSNTKLVCYSDPHCTHIQNPIILKVSFERFCFHMVATIVTIGSKAKSDFPQI